MPTIDIHRHHNKTLQEARTAVTDIADAMAKKLTIKSVWEDDCLYFSRSGVEGHIALSQNQIHIYAKLGLLLSGLRPLIENEILRQLDTHFR